MKTFQPETKLVLPLEPSDWQPSVAETVWAEPLGDDKYRLSNTPAAAYMLSRNDIVLAPVVDGRPTFTRLFQSGGHSTYRLFLRGARTPESADVIRFWRVLERLGCGYEGSKHLLAVDVPPESDIYQVYEQIEAGKAAGVWDFEEGNCAHSLKNSE